MKNDEDLQRLAVLTGQAIARHRKRKGLTQDDVAEMLNIGNEAVSRIERGLRKPNIERLMEFATIFECDLTELLTEASPRATDQAGRIQDLLEPLSADDRQLLVETLERFAKRLTPPKKKR